MKQKNGFALVEMIVAMLIALVLAGIVMTVYAVQAREIRESLAYAKVQRGFDLFHKEFGEDIRFSSRVLDSGEVFDPVAAFPNGTTTSVVITYDHSGNAENRYSLSNDTVLHNSQPFVIGGEFLTVDPDSSFFVLSSSRDALYVSLKLTYSDAQTDVSFKKRLGYFACRN